MRSPTRKCRRASPISGSTSPRASSRRRKASPGSTRARSRNGGRSSSRQASKSSRDGFSPFSYREEYIVNSKKWMIGAVLAAAAAAPSAQQPGFTRAQLQDQNLSVPGRHAVVARAEFIPGGQAGRHTHPGEELGYVVEGTLELSIDGQPPKTG